MYVLGAQFYIYQLVQPPDFCNRQKIISLDAVNGDPPMLIPGHSLSLPEKTPRLISWTNFCPKICLKSLFSTSDYFTQVLSTHLIFLFKPIPRKQNLDEITTNQKKIGSQLNSGIPTPRSVSAKLPYVAEPRRVHTKLRQGVGSLKSLVAKDYGNP